MDGILLQKKCSSVKDEYNLLNVRIGSSFSEESIGTNAVSLSMKLSRPINIIPKYHYCNILSNWHEYCVPIMHDDILGYITLVVTNQLLAPELMVITNLICYKIYNEYIKSGRKSEFPQGKNLGPNAKQLAILKLMSRGLTDYSIASETKLNISTVRYHKQNIFRKYNVSSSIEAVIKALKLKHLSVDDIDYPI